MKKLYIIFIILSIFHKAHATELPNFTDVDGCVKWAINTSEAQSAKDREHYLKDYEYDDENTKYEKLLRNLCIGDLSDIYLNTKIQACEKKYNHDFYLPFNIYPDFPLEKLNGFLDLEQCLNMDIIQLEAKMRELAASYSRMFLLDMNQVIYNIEHNNNIEIDDKSSGICYSENRNKDTIWHALVNSNTNADLYEWYSTCLSALNNKPISITELHRSMFLKQNNQGKTAIAEAIENNTLYRFSKIIEYFKSKNMDYKNILKAAAEEANISYSKLSKALEKGKEIKTKKEVTF